MVDILFVLIILIFFAVCFGLIRFFDSLSNNSDNPQIKS